VPGILSPRKIPFKGAPSGRVYDGAKTAPPLSGIFPGKTIGTYRLDGADRAPPSHAAHVKRRLTVKCRWRGVQSACNNQWRTAVTNGLKRPYAAVATRSLDVGNPQVAGQIAWSRWVVRDRIELSTFRFSGGRSYRLSYLTWMGPQ
jgi:hypothetical protein